MKIFSLLFATLAATANANEFSDACDGKSSGDACVFTLPDGSANYGVCFEPDSPSACGPDVTSCVMCGDAPPSGSGGGSDSSQAAPKVNPSVSACSSKNEGDSCGFTTPDGTKMSGTCADQGAGACGPVDSSDTSTTCYVCSTDTGGGGGGDGPINSNECTGLSVDDVCTVVRGDDEISGVCVETEEDKDTGDGKLACEPVGDVKPTPEPGSGGGDGTGDEAVSTILSDACSNKAKDATCSYTDVVTSKTITGVCVDDGSGTLQCDNESATGGGTGDNSNADDPLVDACANKSRNDDCTIITNTVNLSGTCTLSDDGVTVYCAPAIPTGNRHLRH